MVGSLRMKKNHAPLFGDARDLKILRTHNSVADALQRPDESVGGVFSYEAMRQGAAFFSEVRICGTFAKNLREAVQQKGKGLESLSRITALGTSRKDDYGLVRISARMPEKCPVREVPLHENNILVVFLESDVLLRNEALALSGHPDLLRRALATQLGVELEWREKAGVLSTCCRFERVDSWHSGWALPRPSLVGVQKGGVLAFVVKNPEAWNNQRAAQLERSGIGERRAEGYGRILLNPAFLLSPKIPARKATTSMPHGGANDTANLLEHDESFFHVVEREAVKERIRRAARVYAYDEKKNAFQRKGLSNSQFGALRSAVGTIRDEEKGPVAEGATQALRWLGYEVVKGRGQFPGGQDPWPKSRSEKWGPLRGKILQLMTDEEAVWKELAYFPESVRVTEPSEAQSTLRLRRALWGFAVRALLDAVCEEAFDASDVNTKGGTGA